MNAAVVFFSYEGNTRLVADELAERLDATLVEVSPVPADDRDEAETYTWKHHIVSSPSTPDIRHSEFDPAEFDLIVLGTPVWSGTIAPPIRSFLERHELFRCTCAIYCCYDGRVGSTLHDLEDTLSGNTIVASERFRTPRTRDIETVRTYVNRWADEIVHDARSARETSVG
jgi:flavodoxin